MDTWFFFAVLPIFLSAEWRYLVMINYEVDRAILDRFVPQGTELDLFGGRAFVSMVGFLFLNTRVFGVSFPWHRDFEEVNLRFYVRRRVSESGDAESWRRGTVFIREFVPRTIIAVIARWRYNEPYLARPMRHDLVRTPEKVEAAYRWRHAGRWHELAACAEGGEPVGIDAGSEAEFITEHYWGYNRQRDGSTMEYEVEHPKWRMWHAREHRFDTDVASLYGAEFAPFLSAPASSAFLVEGSAVNVRQGRKMAN